MSWGTDTEPVEVSRHLQALKRAWPLIVVSVVSMTAAVYFISARAPETFEAQARIVMDDRAGGFQSADVETVERRLATVEALLTTPQVLATAAKRLRDESEASLEDKVTASTDNAANIVDVTGKDSTAEGAAAIANAVARSFLALDVAAERQRLARARTQLLRALPQARGAAERRVIREQLSQLSISGSAGSELVLAEPARPPSAASSPRPIRNAVFALFGSVFLAVLAALALGQVAPRLSGPRELSVLTGAPVVAAVRGGRQLGGERILADTAYEQLQSSYALQLPDDAKTVLVVGDLPGRATSAIAAAIARCLADDGSRTLIVSADLRRPRAHEVFGVQRSPGLSDVLDSLRRGNDGSAPSLLERTIVPATATDDDLIDVLPAGDAASSPSTLFASDATVEVFVELELLDYRRVVVEGPALLEGVEGSLLAGHADAVLVVCQLDRLTPENAVSLGELIVRFDRQIVGLVALGVPVGSHALSISPWPRKPRHHVEV
jgi:tyrosine-protein kinase